MMLHILEPCFGTERLSISLELMVAVFDDVDCTIPEHQPACPAFVANMAHQQLWRTWYAIGRLCPEGW